MFQHTALSNDVAHALGAHDCYTASAWVGLARWQDRDWRTLIFAYILQRERQTGILALDNADLAEGALAYDSKQTEVVEVDWPGSARLAVGAGAASGSGSGSLWAQRTGLGGGTHLHR